MRVTHASENVGRRVDGHYGWSHFAMGVMAVVLGAPLSYGAGPVQYWAFDDGSGATAANSVVGGNAGALINFAGGGWTSDTPAALSHSTGALTFSAASSQYVDGGELGLSSVAANDGVTISLWIKPTSFPDSMRLFEQFGPPSSTLSSPYPNGGIAFVNFSPTVGSLFGWDNEGLTWRMFAPTCQLVVNQWHHLGFVWRGSHLFAYVNGNLVGDMSMTFDFDRDRYGNAIRLGIGAMYYLENGTPFDGWMDDFAVWSEALPVERIRELASGVSPLALTPTGTSQPPASPLAEYRLDGDANTLRYTYSGVVGGGAVFIGNDAPFSYVGDASLQFDGIDDGVTIADAPALRPGTNAWSVSLWFKAESADQTGTLIAKRMSESPNTQMNILIAGDQGGGNAGAGKRIHVYVLSGPDFRDWWEITSKSDVADNSWHHVALVREEGVYAPVLYLDGQECPVWINRDWGVRPQDIDCTSPWTIGHDGTASPFKGQIDEVALWNSAISSEHVAWLASHSLAALPLEKPLVPELPLAEYRLDGTARDTRHGFDGSGVGGPAFVAGAGNTPFSYTGDQALRFDGADDGVVVADAPALRPGTNMWSVSLWFKADSADQKGSLIAKRMNDWPVTQMNILVAGDQNGGNPGLGRRLHVYVLSGPDIRDWWEVTSKNDVADNNWHHVALVRGADDGVPILYLDGAVCPVWYNLVRGVRPQDIDCTSPWTVGFDGTASFFAGSIDEVALWDSALSPANIVWLAGNSLKAIPRRGTLISIQ